MFQILTSPFVRLCSERCAFDNMRLIFDTENQITKALIVNARPIGERRKTFADFLR